MITASELRTILTTSITSQFITQNTLLIYSANALLRGALLVFVAWIICAVNLTARNITDHSIITVGLPFDNLMSVSVTAIKAEVHPLAVNERRFGDR